jgi:hypothetical protein
MTFRAGFLILAAAKFFHLSFSQACLLLVGYFGFAALDQWLANRATEKVIDGEVSGWTVDRIRRIPLAVEFLHAKIPAANPKPQRVFVGIGTRQSKRGFEAIWASWTSEPNPTITFRHAQKTRQPDAVNSAFV